MNCYTQAVSGHLLAIFGFPVVLWSLRAPPFGFFGVPLGPLGLPCGALGLLFKFVEFASFSRVPGFWGACSLFATFLCWFLCCTFACIHWPAHTKCHPGDPGISSGKVEKKCFPLFRPHVINPYVLTCPMNSESGARGLFWSVILGTFVTQFGALGRKIRQVSSFWFYLMRLPNCPTALGSIEHWFNDLKPQYGARCLFWTIFLDTFVAQFGALVPKIRQISVSQDNLMTYRQICAKYNP